MRVIREYAKLKVTDKPYRPSAAHTPAQWARLLRAINRGTPLGRMPDRSFALYTLKNGWTDHEDEEVSS